MSTQANTNIRTKCSFCITVRPKEGLKLKLETALVKWIRKNRDGLRLDGAYMAIEKEGEARHAHIQLWYPKQIPRGNVCSPLVRMCEKHVADWCPAQKKVLRSGVKMSYSDWYLDYLEDQPGKEADSFLVVVDEPPSNTSEYYPTEEEQEKLKKKANSVNSKYVHWEELYREWSGTTEPPKNEIPVAKFLSDMMFACDAIRVIADPRKRRQECSAFYYWLTREAPVVEFISRKRLLEIAEENGV